MKLEFQIMGGSLILPKKIFIKEMLSPGSLLTKLLNYQIEDSDKKRAVTVDKKNSEDVVIVNFTEGSNVAVGEDYKNLLHDIKQKYKKDVRGEITLMAAYYTTIFIKLDLNSRDGKIIEITS